MSGPVVTWVLRLIRRRKRVADRLVTPLEGGTEDVDGLRGASLQWLIERMLGMQNEDLVTLTSDIVAAHVSNNQVGIDKMARLVEVVHQALSSLGQDPQPQSKSPVVSVRASIKDEYLVCMECGAKQKTLKRHLMTAHQMTPETYRADYGLPKTYPMTAPAYSRKRGEMAKSFGLGRKGAIERAESQS